MANILLKILSNIFGYSQMMLWIIGMSLGLYECIKKKTSSGLAIDYLLLNAFGFMCMAYQDQFGFWYENASYHMEVHISDLFLSLIGNLFSTFGTAIIFLLPSKSKNVITWMSIVPITIAGGTICVLAGLYGIDTMCVTCGLSKAILSLFSYIPQYLLICRNRTTHGWSMVGVWSDFTGSVIAWIQVILDYFVYGHGFGFFQELNYGKFA